MCGIVGIIDISGRQVYTEDISTMLQRIKHRGPDDEGIFVKDNVGLGHVRLSIIDLSMAGHQPMFSNDGRYCIIFNGEIYNYLELKKKLESSYQFKTKTDTEVLLAAYIKWGEACLPRLNGDFSFVIYDLQQNNVFGARDRFGIKPFYYFSDPQRFVFASEIKAILPVINRDLTPNNKSIFEYLIYSRVDQSDETFFNGILKLKHGHCFSISYGKLKIKKWYNLADQIHYPTAIKPEEYRQELKNAISFRLRSDVPVGVCLSGGIDSSVITSIIRHDFKMEELKTFSAILGSGSRTDESKYINSYKGILKDMYSTTPSAQSFYNEFTDFITSQCEPMPGISPYAQYKVMQLAKGNVVVTLDGQGADEMLGGYNYFYGSYFKELLKTWKILTLLRESSSVFQKKSANGAFAYFVYYSLPVGIKKYAEHKMQTSINNDFYLNHYKSSTISADLYNPNSLHEFFLQHFEHKLEHLLKWSDLNSMSFSIESRIPFLDHHLVEKTLSLPSNLLLKNGISKYILREAVKDILPSQIYNRHDKIGFEAPSADWFRTKPFQDYIYGMLDSNLFRQRGYFNINNCKQTYERHLQGKTDESKDIWKWINLEVWFQKFID